MCLQTLKLVTKEHKLEKKIICANTIYLKLLVNYHSGSFTM